MPTPRVTIDALPEQATPEDANWLVVQDDDTTKKLSIAALKTLESTALTAHLADTSDVHDASAISSIDSGYGIDSTTVQGQLNQLASATGALAGAVSLPEGGGTGQVLVKVTSEDFDVGWTDAGTGVGGGIDGGDASSTYAPPVEPGEPILASADGALGLSIALSATAVKTTVFNPLQLGWAAAYYAEGPEFVALGLADGAQLNPWPDEIGTIDAPGTSTAPYPLYRAAVAALNNRPAVDLSVSARWYQSVATTTITAPHSAVAILVPAAATGTAQQVVAFSGTGNIQIIAPTTTAGQVQGGTDSVLLTSAGGVIGTAACLISNVCKGAGSSVEVNGTSVATGTASSAIAARSITIGSASDCKLAFLGIYSGDIHAHADWAAFKTWAATHYSITIA